jgi:hypothetical protein
MQAEVAELVVLVAQAEVAQVMEQQELLILAVAVAQVPQALVLQAVQA